MPVETFHTLIRRNRRNSAILVAAFVGFFLGMGGLIGYVWGSFHAGPRREPAVPRYVVAPPGPEFGPEAEDPRERAARDEIRRQEARREAARREALARRSDVPWSWTLGVALGAAGLAFVLAMVSYYGGSSVLLGMSKAREVKKADDPQLFNVVEELCLAGGLPLPRIYLIDDTAMNAFATGRDPQHAAVAITTGLRQRLTRDELQGVLAHELAHVRHRDILFATLIAVLVGTLVILCDVFLRSMRWGAYGRSRRGRDSGGGPARAIIAVIAIVLAIVAPILAKIIQLAISRQREYLADAGSVELTRNPDGLASALALLAGDNEVLEVANRATAGLYIVHPIKRFEERSASIFDTHPPIQERIRRLLALHR